MLCGPMPPAGSADNTGIVQDQKHGKRAWQLFKTTAFHKQQLPQRRGAACRLRRSVKPAGSADSPFALKSRYRSAGSAVSAAGSCVSPLPASDSHASVAAWRSSATARRQMQGSPTRSHTRLRHSRSSERARSSACALSVLLEVECLLDSQALLQHDLCLWHAVENTSQRLVPMSPIRRSHYRAV